MMKNRMVLATISKSKKTRKLQFARQAETRQKVFSNPESVAVSRDKLIVCSIVLLRI